MRAPGDLRDRGRQTAPAPSWSVPGESDRAGSGAADAGVLPFRRRRGVPVRRRRRWLGLLRQFAAALLLVGAPAAALGWSATSPRFALAECAVDSGARVDPQWVEGRLAPLVGRNLVWMSMQRVERRLADNPWIGGIEVSKVLPDRLRVAIVERRPVARLETPAGAFWVDREGAVIAPLSPADVAESLAAGEVPPGAAGAAGASGASGDGDRDGSGAPGPDPLILRVAEAAPAAWTDPERPTAPMIDPALAAVLPRALEAVQALSRAAPRWGAALAAVELVGEEDLVFHTAELPFPLLVEPAAVEARVRRLTDLLPELLRRVPQPAAVDLRFENRIVVRPVAAAAAGRNDARGELHG